MSLATYARQITDYLTEQGFEYAEPDGRGGTFPGGVLMDLGGGQKVAFIMPTDDERTAITNLNAYLFDVYPDRCRDIRTEDIVRHHDMLRVHVRFDA